MVINESDDKLTAFKKSPAEWDSAVSLNRTEALYKDASNKFKCCERNFSRQYAHIYASRLNAMQSVIKNKCIKAWGEQIPIRKLSELDKSKNERCIIIGTLFKQQDLKPSILKEISDENQLVPQPKLLNFISSSDQLILEDEIQRIRLIGTMDINKLVTGIVVGVLGVQNANGHFLVESLTFGNDWDISKSVKYSGDERYTLIMSGLEIERTTNMLSLQLLVDWIVGELGSVADQDNQSKICRVIIAGNIVKRSCKPSQSLLCSESEDGKDLLECIKILDNLLLDLVRSVDVDVMPGEFDPSNHTLPQQPIHQCIFPKCSKYATFHRVTNPYECVIQTRRILGTSGQPINDIGSLTDFSENLSILENTLLWSHLAPTAPDTLGCYPYYQEDPFIISKQPDFYFAGNVSKFETKIIHLNEQPVRLICLPAFSETQTCALLNLKTLECTPLQFKVYE